MTGKTLATVVLLAFVGISMAYVVIDNTRAPRAVPMAVAPAPASATPEAAPAVADANGPRFVAYYFMTNVRCPSCMKIEQYTSETLQRDFVDQLDAGSLEWRVVNTDEPENAHFVDDYQLHTKSVVVVELEDGQEKRWKNLDKVWELLGNRDTFQDYVAEELNAFISEG